MVFRALECLLIAGVLRQVLVLVGQALAFSYMRNKESAHALVLRGLSLSTAVGALLFSIITILGLPNHHALQQIIQYPNQWSAFALSNALTSIEIALALGALAILLLGPGVFVGALLTNSVTAAVGAMIGAATGYYFNGWAGLAVGLETGTVSGFLAPFVTSFAAQYGAAAVISALMGYGAFSNALNTFFSNISTSQPLLKDVPASALIGGIAILATLDAPLTALGIGESGGLPALFGASIMSVNTSLLDWSMEKIYQKISSKWVMRG